MSAHVEEQLWSHARGALADQDAKRVDAHLGACAECQRVFQQFKAAVEVVRPVEPPVLDDAAWRRVDSKVMEAARRELPGGGSIFARIFSDWRPFAAAGVLAAAALAFFYLSPGPAQQLEQPVRQDVVATPQPQVAPPGGVEQSLEQPPLEQPPIVDVPKWVDVSTSSGATVADAALAKSVRVGDRIQTVKAGKAFLLLPDGSRAGVTGDAKFSVVEATASNVKLALEQGTLLVAAAHRGDERTFSVAAGFVEVFVVGTRFLVERDERVTVVVEEGTVEVRANGQNHKVSAGETLVFDSAGKVSRKKAVTPAARAAFRELQSEAKVSSKQSAAQTQVAQTDSAQRLTDEDDSVEPVEGGAVAVGQADAGAKFGALTPPPLFDPGEPKQQPVATAQPEKKKFDLLATLKGIDLKNINLDAPYPPVGMPVSEYRVHQLQRNADRGQCERVVERADSWMTEFGADPKVLNRPVLAKAVLFTKARCLTKLGRTADAEKVRQQAEAVR